MIKEWLTRKTNVEDCEREHVVRNEQLGADPIPFGFINQEWLALKSQIQEGDELWEFSSPPEDWKHFRGRGGICIVRRGEIVGSIVIVEN